MLATFLLAWRAFGPGAAAWSLVPLAFASTGAVWLSGRITGGHLTAAAWHAGAFALLAACLDRGRALEVVAALGLWCGLGLCLDSMFAVTLAGLVPAAVGVWLAAGRRGAGCSRRPCSSLAFLAGVWPRYVGARVDPYDAYREQFALVTDPDVLAAHARLLAADCLPRLIAGHRLPGLESDPDPSLDLGAGPARRRDAGFDPLGGLRRRPDLALAASSGWLWPALVVGAVAAAGGRLAVCWSRPRRRSPGSWRTGTSSTRTITDTWSTCWSPGRSGSGCVMDRLVEDGAGGGWSRRRCCAVLLAV